MPSGDNIPVAGRRIQIWRVLFLMIIGAPEPCGMVTSDPPSQRRTRWGASLRRLLPFCLESRTHQGDDFLGDSESRGLDVTHPGVIYSFKGIYGAFRYHTFVSQLLRDPVRGSREAA